MLRCFWCGAEQGMGLSRDPYIHCGKLECTNAARACEREDYEEARREFDRRWGR